MWWSKAVGLSALTLLVLEPGAAAQGVANSLDELRVSGFANAGDTVYITESNGRRSKGRIDGISATSVTLLIGKNMRDFAGTDVQRIELRDSIENGVWIGLGVGVVVAAVSPRLLCDLPDPECAPIAVGVIGLPAVAGGAIIGALVDASIRRTVYLAPGANRSARLRITPILLTTRQGVPASWRF